MKTAFLFEAFFAKIEQQSIVCTLAFSSNVNCLSCVGKTDQRILHFERDIYSKGHLH